MEKIENVQESTSEAFLKQSLHCAFFGGMKGYNSGVHIYYSLCGLNWNVSALGPNIHSFWALSPGLLQYMQNNRELKRLTEQKISSQFSHCQMRYSAEGFSSAGVNSVRLKLGMPCCHGFIFGHRPLLKKTRSGMDYKRSSSSPSPSSFPESPI